MRAATVRRVGVHVATALFLGACGADGPASKAERVVTASPDAMHALTTPDVIARVADVRPAGDGQPWLPVRT